MITRLVKMTFRPECLDEFKELFDSVKDAIGSFPGCRSVSLLKSSQNPCILFTISIWDSLEALENYRQSELFSRTWKKTKTLFLHAAEAWSLESCESAT